MVAEEIMSTKLVVAAPSSTVRHVMSVAMEGDVRHLPVVEEGRLIGIVSDRDLRDAYRRALDGAGGGASPLEQPISEIMSSDLICANPETELEEVIDLMIEHKIGAIPVVEVDSLKLLGIISYVDVLRAARELI
jgi:acetoin utilization protein AcuB